MIELKLFNKLTSMIKRKYAVFTFFVIVFFLLFIFFNLPNNEEDSFLYTENTQQTDNLYVALTLLEDVDNTKSISSESDRIVENIVAQQALLARQKRTILFGEQEQFIDASIELATVRRRLYTLGKYKIVSDYIISKNQNDLNQVFYQQLKKGKQLVYWQKNNLVILVIFFCTVLGQVWFIFSSLVTSDILVEEAAHLSVIQGYPKPFWNRIMVKILNYLYHICLLIVVLTVLSFFLGFWIDRGSLNYPVAVYLNGYRTIPFWSYLFLFSLYSLVLGVFASLLSILFNSLTKNVFISFFCSSILFAFPFLFPEIQGKTGIILMDYLNFGPIIQGKYVNSRFIEVNMGNSLIVLFGCIAGLFFIQKRYLKIDFIRKMRKAE